MIYFLADKQHAKLERKRKKGKKEKEHYLISYQHEVCHLKGNGDKLESDSESGYEAVHTTGGNQSVQKITHNDLG